MMDEHGEDYVLADRAAENEGASADGDYDGEDPPLRGPAHMEGEEGDSEEEEEECRVCRGPAEEGLPLFHPCKCSGSIGLTHQDCLKQWLDVTRGGRCELCQFKFRFAPKYADGAPDHLSPSEVILGLTRRAAVRWLPLGLRAALATCLWLCALPLVTAYLYQGWMRRPSSVAGRWQWELVPGDAVSGAVVAAVVVLSFLSLMSFADFLRFQNLDGGDEEAAAAAVDAGGEAAAADRGARRNALAAGGAAPPVAAIGLGAAAEGPPPAAGGNDDGNIPPEAAADGVDNGFLEHDDDHRGTAGPDADEDSERDSQDAADADAAAPPQRPLIDRNALGVMDQREVVFPHRRERGAGEEEGGAADDDVGEHRPATRRRQQRVRQFPPAEQPREQEGEDEGAAAARGPRHRDGSGGQQGDEPPRRIDIAPEDPLAGRDDLDRRALLAAAALRRQQRREALQDRLREDGQDNDYDGEIGVGAAGDGDDERGGEHDDGAAEVVCVQTPPQSPPQSPRREGLPRQQQHDRYAAGTQQQQQQQHQQEAERIRQRLPVPLPLPELDDDDDDSNDHQWDARPPLLAPETPFPVADDEHDDDPYDDDTDDGNDMLERMMREQQQQEAEEEMLRHLERDDELDELDHDDNDDDDPLLGDFPDGARRGGGNDNEFEPQFEPLDPVFDQDEPVDVEIHVALDELLGLRGPLGALLRNLLWLVAFNTTYLGLFAFVPHFIGRSVYSSLLVNSTVLNAGAGWIRGHVPYTQWLVGNATDVANVTNITSLLANVTGANVTVANAPVAFSGALGNLSGLIHDLNAESVRVNALLQLPEIGTISLGYVSMTLTVFVLQAGVALYGRFRRIKEGDGEGEGEGAGVPGGDRTAAMAEAIAAAEARALGHLAVDGAEGHEDDFGDFDEDEDDDGGLNRRLLGGGLFGDERDGVGVGDEAGDEVNVDVRFNGHDFEEFDDDDLEHDGDDGARNPAELRAEIGRHLGIGLRCATAIVKVGLLLFLKMLLLPLLLGLWLDAATLPLFGNDGDGGHERILAAGRDLFGSVLVHWVVGITFMLLVTVSVLQLREVTHPGLLARVIRPQEPQPDLLGNLLQEDGATHAKRMLLSLGIYAALLTVHVWLPTQLLVVTGIGRRLPFFRPKIYHLVLPQLQVPIELLVFHLSMLAFLEKYKNHIGGMQHRWLVFMCRNMGLTEHVLPREVEKFELVGCRAVFVQSQDKKCNDEYNEHSEQSNDDAGPPPHVDEDAVTDATSASSAEEDGGKPHAMELSGLDKIKGPKKQRCGAGANQHSDSILEIDPFWAQLLSLREKGDTDNVDSFIREHLRTCDDHGSQAAEVQVGVTKPDGRRVLDQSVSYIRLPSTTKMTDNAAHSDVESMSSVKDAESDATASSSSGGVLLPAAIGSYRLCRRRPDSSSPSRQRSRTDATIEFWQEVPGKPIVRPPEGWDDLGVGGAEVQGRWAWGKERMSEVEAGVARRTDFFPDGGDAASNNWRSLRWWKAAIPLALKLGLLLILSWLAVLAVVCFAASAPLCVGRGAFNVLRVPNDRIHDPLAFAVGGAALLPCCAPLLRALAEGRGASLKEWLASFRLPPRRSGKLRVLVSALCIWLVMAPLLMGAAYDLFLDLEVPSVALSWGAGFILLHAWAALCYMGAFRADFWLGIGAAGGDAADAAPDAAGADAGADAANAGGGGVEARRDEDDGLENANQDPAEQDQDRQSTNTVDASRTEKKPLWQGNDGRIGAFASTISDVMARWEWDKVDRIVLLEDCAYRLMRQLATTLMGPILLYFICSGLLFVFSGGRSHVGVVFPFISTFETGSCNISLFRCLSLAVILTQLALAFQSPLQHWFRVAHKAARDDRYLVGEILMNYVANKADANSRAAGAKSNAR